MKLLLEFEDDEKNLLEKVNKELLKIVYDKYHGNRTHMAHTLGVSRRSMTARIERFGLEDMETKELSDNEKNRLMMLRRYPNK